MQTMKWSWTVAQMALFVAGILFESKGAVARCWPVARCVFMLTGRFKRLIFLEEIQIHANTRHLLTHPVSTFVLFPTASVC